MESWPATDSPWLAALYAIGVLIPITIHLLAEHWRSALLWWALAAMTAILFGFGWHFGAQVGSPLSERPIESDAGGPFALSLVLLWLIFLPFLRRRLVSGRWRGDYAQLFTLAWQNKIALAEAAAFTGVLWLLLGLWAMLFKSLGYLFFESVFEWPGFVYPFTCVAFGVALYLTGSVERIVTVVREQLLGLLKWLTPVAALILALFAPTLLVKLPGLVFSGEHAIGATWLLWLITVTVLLLNAGYQNGLGERPYPKLLANALRIVVPAMLVVAATALYSLGVRVAEYGITVERVYAIIVALTAFAYSVGYTVAALRSGPWMHGMQRVNVAVAIGLIAIIALTLTPIASPYRLAAVSQHARALASSGDHDTRDSALRYLRFESGRYGMKALESLSAAKGDAQLAKLAEHAAFVLHLESRWGSPKTVNEGVLAAIRIFPAGRALSPALQRAIRVELGKNYSELAHDEKSAGASLLFIDLDADQTDEAVLLRGSGFAVLGERRSRWVHLGSGRLAGKDPRSQNERDEALLAALAAGDYATSTPRWRDLRIGKSALGVAVAIDEPEWPAAEVAEPIQ